MRSADGIGVGRGGVGADLLSLQRSAVEGFRAFGCGMGFGVSLVPGLVEALWRAHPVRLSVTQEWVWGSFQWSPTFRCHQPSMTQPAILVYLILP